MVKIENDIPKDVAKSIKRDRLIPLCRSITPKEYRKKIAALLIDQIRNPNSVNKMHILFSKCEYLAKRPLNNTML